MDNSPRLRLSALALLIVSSLVSLSAAGKSRRSIPVLLLMEDVPEACKCSATVGAAYLSGQSHICVLGGLSQPCFSVVVEGTPQLGDVPGVCQSAGQPPQVPECKKEECVFAERKIRVQAADCAASGTCGVAPYRLKNAVGVLVGQKFTAGESEAVTVSLGLLSCGQTDNYTIRVVDSAAPNAVVKLEYKLTAACAQCARGDV
jgi:hypothetical protein